MTDSQSAAGAKSQRYLPVVALIDELVRSGVRHFSVCPGSRSTPLALAVAQQPRARLWMHLDERSASFFGLGLAKTLREPVALICSSGTAAANFMPAVVEAFYARVPLIVLTADRPHDLRDCGAPQTIDQNRLFGVHAKWFVDLPEPEPTVEQLRYVRTIACEAAATARRGPAGPVHLNWPFREPLAPVPIDDRQVWDRESRGERPYVSVIAGARAPSPEYVEMLATQLGCVERGLIVCGPQDDPTLAGPLTALARVTGYPILADPLSGLRCGHHDRAQVLDCYDAVLHDDGFVRQHAPEVILRFGAMPTSKPVLQYIERYPDCRQILVDGDAGWNEPTRLAQDVVHADAGLFCTALADALPRGLAGSTGRASWNSAWRAADRLAREAITEELDGLDELFEGKVFAELARLLPDGSTLYAGNSMPVRDVDTFFPAGERAVRVLANRGANGIDGVVSSALGASAAGTGPLVLAIGDVSFYHDANGLLAAKRHGLNATIVLLHNDGGGIFSFLPQAAEPEHFETLFGTPHGLDFRPLAEMYGARFTRVSSWVEFRAAVAQGIAGGGLNIVEVPTERQRNVALHRRVWSAVSRALAEHLLAATAV